MRLGVGYVDDEFVFVGLVYMSEIDIGVVSCVFDNSIIWMEEIMFFSIFDDVEGCMIFYGVVRVYEFGFVEDFVFCLIGDVI